MTPSRKEALTAMAVKMTEACERMNKAIETTETDLQAIGLGVPGEIPLYEETVDSVIFGYGKFDHVWRLYTKKAAASEKQFLTNAPRQNRIQAAKRLDALLDRLFEIAEDSVEAVDLATDQYAEFSANTRAMKDS